MNPYALPSFIASLPFFILGLTALSLNPRDRTTRLLSAMCLGFTLSGVAVGLFHLSTTFDEARFWNRWPYAIILPGILAIMEYCVEASGRDERLRERLFGLPLATHRIAAVITLSAAWILAVATDWIITTPEDHPTTGWEHGYGWGFPLFLIAITYVLGLFVYILWRGVRAADDPITRRFRQISLLALGGGMLVASLLGFVLPGLFGSPTHSFAFLPLVVTVLLLTYGVMRLQFETILDLGRGLEAKVDARTLELKEANEKLNEVHGQISRYLDPNVVKQIFAGTLTATLDHRRTKLTLFFSDIDGFTRFTDSADPEDVAALLNEYLGEMANLVREYGGTIAQFSGDAVFAIFGAPESRGVKADALACVHMAMRMQESAERLRRLWWDNGFQFPLRIRCGINTGMANVGNYGSEGFMEFSAVGLNANLAARLEQACEPGRIYLSHSTWGLVKEAIPCEQVGTIEVKGFHDPVPAYRVVEWQPARSEDGRPGSGGVDGRSGAQAPSA